MLTSQALLGCGVAMAMNANATTPNNSPNIDSSNTSSIAQVESAPTINPQSDPNRDRFLQPAPLPQTAPPPAPENNQPVTTPKTPENVQPSVPLNK